MKYLTLIFWMHAAFAQAATMVAFEHQETVVVINSEVGSLIDLPAPVKTVTPAKFFVLQEAAAAATGATAATPSSDVRTFLVKPVPQAEAEVVTFVLASGQALALKFMPAATADKYYAIVFDVKRRSPLSKFLGPELAMLRAMLLDEAGGFAREVIADNDPRAELKVDFAPLEFRLARIYATADQTGYVFVVRNRGGQVSRLQLSSLAFAKPNRAVLAQVDKTELTPCPLLGVGPDCQTALRLIVRGPKAAQPLLMNIGPSQPPFVQSAAGEGQS